MRLADDNSYLTVADYVIAHDSWSLSILRSTVSAGRGATQPIDDHPQPARFLQVGNRRFCPSCLGEAAYWRHGWEYSLVVYCLRHKAWLEDRCATCGATIKFWQQPSPYCQACGELLRPVEQHPLLRDDHLEVLTSILARSAGPDGWLPDLVDYSVPWTLPSPLAYQQLAKVVLLLGAYGRGRHGRPRKAGFKDDVRIARSIIAHAAHALFPWPEAFHGLLAELRDTGQSSLSGSMSYFYKALYREFEATEVGFLRHEVEVYLREHWDGVLSQKNSYFPPDMAGAHRFQAMTRVARERSLPASLLLRAVESGQLPGSVRKLPSGRSLVTLRVDLLDELRSDLELQTLEAASSELGLPERRLREILKAGVLPGRPPNGGGAWAIARADLRQFAGSLAAAAAAAPSRQGRLIPLRQVVRFLAGEEGALAEFLRAVQGGAVSLCHLEDDTLPLFQRLTVEPRNLRAWQLSRQGRLSLPHAAEYLGLKQAVIYHLCRKGHLHASSSRDHGTGLSEGEISRFSRELLSASDMATSLATSPKALISALAAVGVSPISGPMVDGGRQVFYRWDVLAEKGFLSQEGKIIDLAVRESSSRSRPRCPGFGDLSSMRMRVEREKS